MHEIQFLIVVSATTRLLSGSDTLGTKLEVGFESLVIRYSCICRITYIPQKSSDQIKCVCIYIIEAMRRSTFFFWSCTQYKDQDRTTTGFCQMWVQKTQSKPNRSQLLIYDPILTGCSLEFGGQAGKASDSVGLGQIWPLWGQLNFFGSNHFFS